MFSEGKKPSVIVYCIQNEFGFGSKMVFERIKFLVGISSKDVVKFMKKR